MGIPRVEEGSGTWEPLKNPGKDNRILYQGGENINN